MNDFYKDDQNRLVPFTTPDDYFEALPARIQRRITAPHIVPSYGRSVPQWAYYTFGFVVLIVGSVWLTVGLNISATGPANTASAEQLLAEVPEDIIIDYLLQVEVDVMATVPLTESEQQELLEQELDMYEYTEEAL